MTLIPVDPRTLKVLDGSVIWADIKMDGWGDGSTYKMRHELVRVDGLWRPSGRGGRGDCPPELGSKEFRMSQRYAAASNPYPKGYMQTQHADYEMQDLTYNVAYEPMGDGSKWVWQSVQVPAPKPPRPELVVERKWVRLEWGWGDALVECRCCGERLSHRRLLADYLMEADELVLVRGCPACHIRDCCEIILGEPEDWMVRAAVEEDFRNGAGERVWA